MRALAAVVAILAAACQPAAPREVPRPPAEESRELPPGAITVLPMRGGQRTTAFAYNSEHQLLLTAERAPSAIRLWDDELRLRASFSGTFSPGSHPWRPDALQIAVLVEVGVERPEVSVRIVDVTTGRALRSWVPRQWSYEEGTRLSWSGTGTMLLLEGGTPDGLVLNVSDGHTVASLKSTQSSWCPADKPLLASLASDGKLTVRNLDEALVFEATASAFAWEPGCERLALLQADGSLQLWTPGTEGAPLAIGSHDGATKVVFSPAGNTIATVSSDVQLWGQQPGDTRGRLDTVPSYARELARFDREGKLFGAYDGAGLGLWQVDVARPLASLALTPPERGAFDVVGDLAFVVTGDHLKRWDVRSGEQRLLMTGRTSVPVTALRWSEDDTKLAAAYGDGLTRIIDLAGSSALQQKHPSNESREAWLSERGFAGEELAAEVAEPMTVSPSGAVTIHSAGGEGIVARFAAPMSGRQAAALRSDLSAVALRGWDSTVRVYELSPFRLVGKIPERQDTFGLVWHSNGELLLIEGRDPSLRSADGAMVRSLGDQRDPASWGKRDRDHQDVLHGSFSADGCVLHTFGHHTHWLRDARSGMPLANFDLDGRVGPLAWSHGGGVLAMATEDGDLILWRTHDGRRLTLRASELAGALALVAYTDDGIWAGDSRAGADILFRIGAELLTKNLFGLDELPKRMHLPTLAGDFAEGRQLEFR